MAIDYKKLPVYEQKDLILNSLKDNQVVIVESPTGSGKTTQIPVILHEAGFDKNGIIAVTQPRRIAALSVSEFISKQLGTTYPGLVGYKMRFEDKTDATTKIKIMTDGILLQEMKLDPWLSKYSVIMVDEAHERSLNIDFVLGLLKRVLEVRKDFKVIVSSATMNTEIFSKYFNNAPIVSIETVTYPVTLIYDPPMGGSPTTLTDAGCDALLTKIEQTVERVLDNKDDGGILIFLPGEKIIRDCSERLYHSSFGRRLFILPLYGRLAKEEQERVFETPPLGKKKVVISTNIAETSVTISDISTVIDSGLCKLNFYNPHTFTSSLIESTISKASCNQRRGRAGRTHEGTCYRLYSRKDFETRPQYTTEEIYRTDLSEVVLRMSELGITDFTEFDFINKPEISGIYGAIDTLNLLGALDEDHTLSSIGRMMVKFPLEPRISRILVEAIMRFPESMGQALIAASFLSANSPFLLPPGEEMEARHAHHRFRDLQGDFVSYLHIFKAYQSAEDKEKFCKNAYLDQRVMAEIENINFQLTQIISDMGIPVSEKENTNDYLCCIASGMIQFVCIREGKENYRSLTQDHICIHPGSVMFRQDPLFIVAGEIIKTSRMFASSVSPLTKALMDKINPELFHMLDKEKKASRAEKDAIHSQNRENFEKNSEKRLKKQVQNLEKSKDDALIFGNEAFAVKKIKGKKVANLELEKFLRAASAETDESKMKVFGQIKSCILLPGGGTLLPEEKLSTIIKISRLFDLHPIREDMWNRKLNINIEDPMAKTQLMVAISNSLRVAMAKQKQKEYGFITLFTDSKGNYWQKVSRGFSTAVNETLSSLEVLTDEEEWNFSEDEKDMIGILYQKLSEIYH